MFKVTKLHPFGALLEPLKKNDHINKLDQNKLREIFSQYKLLLLRGFETFSNSEDFSNYCKKWGEIALWPFGKVLELKEQKNPQDHIFDHSYVPLHWDGMYRPRVPELQIFHCALAPEKNTGGETTFSNTLNVLAHAKTEDCKLWSQVTGVYQRKMEFYHSKTVAPIISKHPTQNFSVIRYCEPPKEDDKNFINHPDLNFTGLEQESFKIFQESLHKDLYSDENFYAHSWQTGDIVLANNHVLLHGRKAFKKGSPRYLRRVHVIGETAKNNPHLVFHQ